MTTVLIQMGRRDQSVSQTHYSNNLHVLAQFCSASERTIVKRQVLLRMVLVLLSQWDERILGRTER